VAESPTNYCFPLIVIVRRRFKFSISYRVFLSLQFATVYFRSPQTVLFLGTELGTGWGTDMANKLTARKVETAKPGKYSDGGNLYLIVSETGARKWVLRFTWRGRAKEMGLGSAASVPLADAREKAASARRRLPKGSIRSTSASATVSTCSGPANGRLL
jgi:hypothetical protein